MSGYNSLSFKVQGIVCIPCNQCWDLEAGCHSLCYFSSYYRAANNNWEMSNLEKRVFYIDSRCWRLNKTVTSLSVDVWLSYFRW